jgi:hypothetical protein
MVLPFSIPAAFIMGGYFSNKVRKRSVDEFRKNSRKGSMALLPIMILLIPVTLAISMLLFVMLWA